MSRKAIILGCALALITAIGAAEAQTPSGPAGPGGPPSPGGPPGPPSTSPAAQVNQIAHHHHYHHPRQFPRLAPDRSSRCRELLLIKWTALIGARAHAFLLFDEQDAAEKIEVLVEPRERGMLRGVDSTKMHAGRGASLDIVLCDTLNMRAISRVGSPASRRLIASFFWCAVSLGGRPI